MSANITLLFIGVVTILLIRHFMVRWVDGTFPAQQEILRVKNILKEFFSKRKRKKMRENMDITNVSLKTNSAVTPIQPAGDSDGQIRNPLGKSKKRSKNSAFGKMLNSEMDKNVQIKKEGKA